MKRYLLLNMVRAQETPIQAAVRRGNALRNHRKQEVYEKLLREELAAIQDLRQLMREPPPKRKWRIAAE